MAQIVSIQQINMVDGESMFTDKHILELVPVITRCSALARAHDRVRGKEVVRPGTSLDAHVLTCLNYMHKAQDTMKSHAIQATMQEAMGHLQRERNQKQSRSLQNKLRKRNRAAPSLRHLDKTSHKLKQKINKYASDRSLFMKTLVERERNQNQPPGDLTDYESERLKHMGENRATD